MILAIPPSACCNIVDGAESTALVRWRDQARPVSVACLDLGLRTLPRPQVRFVMGIDTPFLFTHQSNEAGLGFNGAQIVHVVKYHGTTDPDATRDERELERVMDCLQPGWRQVVVAKQSLPRMAVVYDYDHIARVHTPGPRVPEVPGLYVAGDWAGQGESLADAAAASAKRAVGALQMDAADREEEIIGHTTGVQHV